MAIGRELFTPPLTAEQMESMGWEPEDFEDVPVDVWPDHEQAFELACYLRTQLRTSFGGVLGFDYTPADAWMRRRQLSNAQQIQLEQQLSAIEAGMLQVLNKPSKT